MADLTLPRPADRNYYFTKQVDQGTISELTQKIIEINESDREAERIYAFHGLPYVASPIKIFIDSYGGAVYQCFGLIGIMDQSKTPIHTIVTGAAMSCGFMISICGHKRFAYKHATLMYHQVSSGVWGKLAEMQQDVVETERLQKIIESITVERTRIMAYTLKENFEHKRDWFMNVDEALKNGCIDDIVGG